MNTTQLHCFLEGARCLNFTEAAENLHITQPAFSRNISSLEDEWGFHLFLRDNKRKGTRLTPAGAVMYAGMQRVQGHFAELLEQARRIHAGKEGKLSLGFLDGERIDDMLLRMMDRFRKDYPDVDTVFKRGSYRQLVEWLHDGSLDVAITLKIDVADKSWIVYEELYYPMSVLIASADHPNVKRKKRSLYDFKDGTFLGLASRDSQALNALLDQECERAGFTPKTLIAPDLKTQMLWLETGQGIAITSPNNLVTANKHLTMLKLKDLIPLQVVAAWNRENYNPSIARFHSCYDLIK
mgnify:CR=1 FL=1